MECFTLSKKGSFNSAVISNAFPHKLSKSYSKLFLFSKRKNKGFFTYEILTYPETVFSRICRRSLVRIPAPGSLFSGIWGECLAHL